MWLYKYVLSFLSLHVCKLLLSTFSYKSWFVWVAADRCIKLDWFCRHVILRLEIWVNFVFPPLQRYQHVSCSCRLESNGVLHTKALTAGCKKIDLLFFCLFFCVLLSVPCYLYFCVSVCVWQQVLNLPPVMNCSSTGDKFEHGGVFGLHGNCSCLSTRRNDEELGEAAKGEVQVLQMKSTTNAHKKADRQGSGPLYIYMFVCACAFKALYGFNSTVVLH